MFNKVKRFLKRNWKNIALVTLSLHFVVDVTAYANLGYSIYTFFA